MKYILRFACLILLLGIGSMHGQSTDQKIDIALLLTDSYRFLGEGTAKDAQKALKDQGINARVKTYYHADFDHL
ncbi:MAG: hypothetical protein AAGA86_07300, partial [Bacteroidota bacterium]